MNRDPSILLSDEGIGWKEMSFLFLLLLFSELYCT